MDPVHMLGIQDSRNLYILRTPNPKEGRGVITNPFLDAKLFSQWRAQNSLGVKSVPGEELFGQRHAHMRCDLCTLRAAAARLTFAVGLALYALLEV